MAEKPDIKKLVDQMPEPDPGKGKLTGPKWADAEKVYDPILAGGRDAVLAVIDMLQETDDGKDQKARYALHGLGVYVCRKGNEEHRATVIAALVSRLGGDRPKAIRRFLVRQLQTVGDGRAADALGKLLLDEDLCEPAAQALVAIDPAAAARQLRRALPEARGKCRLTIVQGLGVVGDAASADALKRAVGDEDRDVRIAAALGLADLGDAGAVETLIKAADAEAGWERIQAAKACLVLAEKLRAAGKKRAAAKLYKHLRDTRTDESEHYLRDAAAKALAQ